MVNIAVLTVLVLFIINAVKAFNIVSFNNFSSRIVAASLYSDRRDSNNHNVVSRNSRSSNVILSVFDQNSKPTIMIDGVEYIEIDMDDLTQPTSESINFKNGLTLSARVFLENLENGTHKVTWPGTRPPLTQPGRYDQKMDATWGRGKYRSEVWDNRLNPVNNWWECYTQSIEEMEAMHAGYDFENPEEYFKEKGIDYAQALEQFKVDTNASYEAYRLDKFAPFEPEKWETVKKQFLPLKEMYDKNGIAAITNIPEYVELEKTYIIQAKKAYEHQFRVDDNKKQAQKGQPSLDDEETGEKYKNDPV